MTLALGVLGALPCVVHCDRSHEESAPLDSPSGLNAWFLCDFPVLSSLPVDQTAPHHYHIAPQAPVVPAPAFAGIVAIDGDRIDSFLFAVPAAYLFFLVRGLL